MPKCTTDETQLHNDSIYVPYIPIDLAVVANRFPYSTKRMQTVISSCRSDGSISLQALPVRFFYPVSVLVSCSKIMDYIHILYESEYESLSKEDRLLVILKYFFACCSNVFSKVFFSCTPFLGETFSCFVNCCSKRVSFIAEQCTVHPSTTAFYIEDKEKLFHINCCYQPKYVFCGSSIRCTTRGFITIQHRDGDTYTLSIPTYLFSSLLHGVPEIQLCNTVNLKTNHSYSAEIHFIQRSMLGGDARTVKAVVRDAERIVLHIQGRWDIGYELLRNGSHTYEELLIIHELKANQRFILKNEFQGSLESVQVWKMLEKEMLEGDDEEGSQRVLMKIEAKKKQYQKMMEKTSDYSEIDRFLFSTKKGSLEYMFKNRGMINEDLLNDSRSVQNGITNE